MRFVCPCPDCCISSVWHFQASITGPKGKACSCHGTVLSVKSKFQRDGGDDDPLLVDSMAFATDLFRACFVRSVSELGKFRLVVNIKFEVKLSVQVQVKTEI